MRIKNTQNTYRNTKAINDPMHGGIKYRLEMHNNKRQWPLYLEVLKIKLLYALAGRLVMVSLEATSWQRVEASPRSAFQYLSCHPEYPSRHLGFLLRRTEQRDWRGWRVDSQAKGNKLQNLKIMFFLNTYPKLLEVSTRIFPCS